MLDIRRREFITLIGGRGDDVAARGVGAAGRWNATCCRSHGHRDHRAWTILAELLAFSPSDGIPW